MSKLRLELENSRNQAEGRLGAKDAEFAQLARENSKLRNKIEQLEKELVSERLYKEKDDTIAKMTSALAYSEKHLLLSQAKAS